MNGDKTLAPYPETYPRGPGQPATSSQRALCISVVGSRKKDTPSLGRRAFILIPSGRHFTLTGRTVPSLWLLWRHRDKGISRHCGGSIGRVCMYVLAKAGALVPASMEYQISSGRRPCVSRAYCARDDSCTCSPPLFSDRLLMINEEGLRSPREPRPGQGRTLPGLTYTEHDLVPQRVTAAAGPALLARVLNPVLIMYAYRSGGSG